MKTRRSTQSEPRSAYLERVAGAFSLLVLHETGSLQGHAAAVQERLQIARRARGLGELLRDQIDLLPESRNRLRRDHQIRRELWRGWIDELTPKSAKAA